MKPLYEKIQDADQPEAGKLYKTIMTWVRLFNFVVIVVPSCEKNVVLVVPLCEESKKRGVRCVVV